MILGTASHAVKKFVYLEHYQKKPYLWQTLLPMIASLKTVIHIPVKTVLNHQNLLQLYPFVQPIQ